MVFELYRRLMLSSEINLCILNIQKYKSEVFDNIPFHFGYRILCKYTFSYSLISYVSPMAT